MRSRERRRLDGCGGKRWLTQDPVDPANALVKAGRAASFDPFDDESSRVVAAGAIVHAMSHPAAVELTISAAAAEEPPSTEEWASIFDGLNR